MATPFGEDGTGERGSSQERGRHEARETARGDIEQVRVRRVERADLVREILEKKQAEDPGPREQEPPRTPEQPGPDSPSRAPEADEPGPGAAASGAEHWDATPRPQQQPSDMPPLPALIPQNSEPRESRQPAVLRPEPLPSHSAPSVDADEAVAPTLQSLAEWRAAEHEARQRVLAAQEQAGSPRRRDRLDPADDFVRALRAAGGADFLRGLVDEVLRPDDLLASGFGLSDLKDEIPETLTPHSRRLFRLGAFAGPGIPFIAVPAVRRAARAFFGKEVTGARELERDLGAAAEQHAIPRVLPLTDPILGDAGADALFERVRELLHREDVPEIEIAWGDLEPRPSEWDFEGTVEHAAMRFAALLQEAANSPHPTLLVLRAEGSRDLEQTVETISRVMGDDGLGHARLGISAPVDLPESSTLLRRLAGRAHLRREDGGAPVRIGLYRLADRESERADAVRHGWKVATYLDEGDVDANMMQVIDAVLAPEHRGVLELELSGAEPMDIAFAVHLARMRESFVAVSAVLDEGDDAGLRERYARLGARVHIRIPLLPEDSYRPACAYLWGRVTRAERRLAQREAARDGQDGVHAEDDRLLQAIARMHRVATGPVRSQVRIAPEEAPGITASIALELFPEGLLEEEPAASAPEPGKGHAGFDPDATTVLGRRGAQDGSEDAEASAGRELRSRDEGRETGVVRSGAGDSAPLNPAETGAAPNLTEVVMGLRRGRLLRNTFRNEPCSDPTVAATREWATRVQRRAARSDLGRDEAASHRLRSADEIDEVLERAQAAGESWSQTSGWERAARLEQLAKAVEANRARLIEVAMNETGLTFAEVDADVSRAVDLANYDAHLARQLDRMQGARFEPVQVSLAVPGWIPPVSSTAAGVFGALAAGSAVVLKPSPRTPRTAAVLARVLWSTDLPDDLLQVASGDDLVVTEEQLGRQLIVDPRVERMIMQGAYGTAKRFFGWRHDLPVVGSSGGKSSVVVTPAADYDQAAADIAASFTAATGQLALRPSTVVLVGAAARSERFVNQLVDAVTSTRVGYPSDHSVHTGPLVARAVGEQLAMLTELTGEEKWLVEPRSLDDTGRLWTPGIRTGVTEESPVLRNATPVPVVNIVTVRTLDEAVALQNRIDYGLGAGLFSLDRAEIAQWVQQVEAGSLFVNRDVLGITVQRQPSGGWKQSMIGTKMKSGGPNALMHLGKWRADEHEQSHTLHLRGLEDRVARLIEALQPGMSFDEFERVRRTALSCQIAWNEEFGEVVDATNLPVERNLFRYRPVDCVIRFSEDATADALGQVLVAATVARARILLSSAWPLPASLAAELELRGAGVRVETNEEFLERLRVEGLRDALRLRLIGGSRSEVCEAISNAVEISVFSDDVTLAGRVEMLPFLREQTISIRAERHGRPDPRVARLFPHELVRDPDASLLGRLEA